MKSKKKVGNGIIKDAIKKIKDKLRDWILPSDLPQKFKEILNRWKDKTIVNITVARDPVQKMVQKFINLLSGGDYEKAKTKLNYDDVFHLYLIITLDAGDGFRSGTTLKLRLEKNHVIMLKKYDSTPKDTMNVNVNKKITLGEFIKKGIDSIGIKSFVRYDAVTLNCQNFVSSLLSANGLNNSALSSFINQDASKLLTGKTREVAGVITDIANVAGTLAGGKKRKVGKGKVMNVTKPMFTTMPVKQKQIGAGVCRF